MLNPKDFSEDLQKCGIPKKGTSIITPICRLSYPNLLVSRPGKKGDATSKKKFGTSLLIPAGFDISLLKKDAGRAATEKWGDKAGSMRLKSPFLDAGEYDYQGYEAGWTLVRATCMSKPRVLMETDTGERISITEENSEEIYPGRWCVATIRAFWYEESGNKGVSFGLNNVFLLNNDEPLGGKMRAEDEFEDFGSYDNTASKKGTVEDLF